MYTQFLPHVSARMAGAALLLTLAALAPLAATAQLESSASICLAVVGGPCDPSVGASDIGTTSAAAAIGGASAKAETDYGRYAAFVSVDVTGGRPAATSRAYSIDTLTLSGGPGTQGTIWFTYELSGSITTGTVLPALNLVFVHFEMSAAPSGESLVVNPANWTRYASAQPATLVYQDEKVYVPVIVPYDVPYDIGTSLRAMVGNNFVGPLAATVDFFNTATLARVDIPLGATLSAASGVDYLKFGAPVPLPGALSLLAPGALLLLAHRRQKKKLPA